MSVSSFIFYPLTCLLSSRCVWVKEMQARSQQQQLELELESNSHPHSYTVVWTTLPLVSAILPTIGHVGIADSHGVIRDFSGPYTVGSRADSASM